MEAKPEGGDSSIFVSYGIILSGSYSDVKRLRDLIVDFLGARMGEDGHIHQDRARMKSSLRLIYQTVSSTPLYIVREKEWRRLRDGGNG